MKNSWKQNLLQFIGSGENSQTRKNKGPTYPITVRKIRTPQRPFQKYPQEWRPPTKDAPQVRRVTIRPRSMKSDLLSLCSYRTVEEVWGAKETDVDPERGLLPWKYNEPGSPRKMPEAEGMSKMETSPPLSQGLQDLPRRSHPIKGWGPRGGVLSVDTMHVLVHLLSIYTRTQSRPTVWVLEPESQASLTHLHLWSIKPPCHQDRAGLLAERMPGRR